MQIPNHTQIPNSVIDNMVFLSGSELKVFIAICRKTIGWHKKTDRISHSQIRELTGLSINALKRGINGLNKKNIIIQEKSPLGYIYKINYTVSINDIANIDIANIDKGVSKIDIKNGKIVSKNDTTKDIYKETIQNKSVADKSALKELITGKPSQTCEMKRDPNKWKKMPSSIKYFCKRFKGMCLLDDKFCMSLYNKIDKDKECEFKRKGLEPKGSSFYGAVINGIKDQIDHPDSWLNAEVKRKFNAKPEWLEGE